MSKRRRGEDDNEDVVEPPKKRLKMDIQEKEEEKPRLKFLDEKFEYDKNFITQITGYNKSYKECRMYEEDVLMKHNKMKHPLAFNYKEKAILEMKKLNKNIFLIS